MTAAQIIDAIEQALQRQRNLDPALKAWYIAQLDELRELSAPWKALATPEIECPIEPFI
ncbi:hypothetical protein NDK50_07980 [Paraburkholderia bryophila]|uniref:hypothetical protein n=1 Tax=Paraburkholderia bryophila TaxID=420952 RepID=UPI002349A7AD|nr:hypothetical protein [Paraburkholderia bryophila]WCM21374.1 hypothetical protein NDK50_07980 [Paraburkholderia bryophila]